MNRFLINLRSLDDPTSSRSGAPNLSTLSAPVFREPSSILGNIGAELIQGTDDVDEVQDAIDNGCGEIPESGNSPDASCIPMAGPSGAHCHDLFAGNVSSIWLCLVD